LQDPQFVQKTGKTPGMMGKQLFDLSGACLMHIVGAAG